jgi:hypothetical protein
VNTCSASACSSGVAAHGGGQPLADVEEPPVVELPPAAVDSVEFVVDADDAEPPVPVVSLALVVSSLVLSLLVLSLRSTLPQALLPSAHSHTPNRAHSVVATFP